MNEKIASLAEERLSDAQVVLMRNQRTLERAFQHYVYAHDQLLGAGSDRTAALILARLFVAAHDDWEVAKDSVRWGTSVLEREG